MSFAAIYLLSSLIIYQAIAKQAQQQHLFMLTMTQVKPFQRETSPEHFFPPMQEKPIFHTITTITDDLQKLLLNYTVCTDHFVR